ncbi:hypothetical protein ACFVQB_19605 [Paenibacillus sp. NPDC057886]|uniref:hypothetical protein n=1 Tax=Paenibacillus sp. NPDC057886 TaxID=3346270 RepID=UPI0036C909EA
MLKKLIAVSLVAAMALPVTGAFASSNPTDRFNPNTQNGIDSRITISPDKDQLSAKSIAKWTVNTAANIRATPSPTGAHVLTVYPGFKLHSESGDYTVVNGVTWVFVWNDNGIEAGYILLSALTASN